MDVHEPGVGGMAVSPHLFEELLAGKDLPGGARQRGEQVEFEGGQRDDAAPAFDDVAGDVDRQVLQGQALVGLRVLAAAQSRAYAGHEFLGFEGLGDVVVRASFEPGDDVGRIRAGGQHNDRHVGDATDCPAHVEAVHAGEHDVEEDQVRVVFLKLSQRL